MPFYHSLWVQSQGPSFAIYGNLPNLTSVHDATYASPFSFTLLLALVFAALSPSFLSYMLQVASPLDKLKASHTKSYYTTHTTIITSTFILSFTMQFLSLPPSTFTSLHSTFFTVIHSYRSRLLSFVNVYIRK